MGPQFRTGPGTFYPLASIPIAQAAAYWFSKQQWRVQFSGSLDLGAANPYVTADPLGGLPYNQVSTNQMALDTGDLPYGLGRYIGSSGLYYYGGAGTRGGVGASTYLYVPPNRADGTTPRSWLAGMGDCFKTPTFHERFGRSHSNVTFPAGPGGTSITGTFSELTDTGLFFYASARGVPGGPPGMAVPFYQGGQVTVQILGTTGSIQTGSSSAQIYHIPSGLLFDPTKPGSVFMALIIACDYATSLIPWVNISGGTGYDPTATWAPDPSYVASPITCQLDGMTVPMFGSPVTSGTTLSGHVTIDTTTQPAS